MPADTLKTPSALPGFAVLGNVVALRAAGGDDKGLPSRVKLLSWGENLGRTTGARIVVGEKTLKCLSVNQRRFARDSVALDYEHQSVPGHPRFKDDPRHNAGHGEIEIVEGEGVFLSSLNYTPNGREHAPSYADVSAVAHLDSDGNLLMVSSVALTQAGDVSGMTFDEAVAVLSAAEIPQPKKPMEKKNDKFRDLLVSILALKPADGETEVSDEAIAAAAASHLSGAIPKDKEDKEGKKGEAPEDIVAMSARIDAMEKTNLIQGATMQGKVVPLSADEVGKTPLSVLRSMIEKLPAGEAPLTRKGKDEIPGDKEVALSADDEKVMKQLDLTKEEYLAASH